MVTDTLYAVIRSEPTWVDPVVIAKALAQFRHTPEQDQLIAARRTWGILGENLTGAQAQDLQGGLQKAGLSCLACPMSSLAAIGPSESIARMDEVPPDDIHLISAAAIKITTRITKQIKEGPSAVQKVASTGIFLATGLPIKIGGQERTRETTREESDLFYYLDVNSIVGKKRARLQADRFDYSFLKEKKVYQVFGNFKIVLQELVARHPSAWKNHGAELLLQNQPIQKMGYESLDDLDRETRWLLTLKERSKNF